MRSISMRLVSILAPAGLLLWSGLAAAAQESPTPEPTPALPQPLLLTPPLVLNEPQMDLGQVVVRERVTVAAPRERVVVAGPRERVVVEGEGGDGVRLRIGASAMIGPLFADSTSAVAFGGEARIGVQVNHLIGIFGTPHFVVANFGGGALNTIGVFAATADVDFTFVNHFYVGAGGGFGIVNNPSGPVLHFRIGGYPLVGRGPNGIRRRGLQIGADIRNYFTSGGLGGLGTVTEFTGGIGFDFF
jgi:hypothetical protein